MGGHVLSGYSSLQQLPVPILMLLFCHLACSSQQHQKPSESPAPPPPPFNYTLALSKCLLFLECQRSGSLPPDQRIVWRGDSALLDGRDSQVDLAGGYYDAGDNVKFGFPMAFTITILSWGTLECASLLSDAGELQHIQSAIRWGTDYFLKAITGPTQLWVQVGDANADHNCWERPESMDTPRTTYQVNASSPGTEVAAETAAALASASIVFRDVDFAYSNQLLQKAMMIAVVKLRALPHTIDLRLQLFNFADRYRASYTGECPFYCSYSGYNDELLWGAAWLYKATENYAYLLYIQNNIQNRERATEFSWDNKFAGLGVLLSKMYFDGEITLQPMKSDADFFICANLPGNPITQVSRTPGGLLYVRPGANTQYAGGVAFLATVYADYLSQNQCSIVCGNREYFPEDILCFAQDQVDYILGKNPMNMSYMVGFGKEYPQQAHHRGASITENVGATRVTCGEGFSLWFNRDAPNPNELVGAIVGGPDAHDGFNDHRSNSEQLEPTTYINALFAGALARLSSVIDY